VPVTWPKTYNLSPVPRQIQRRQPKRRKLTRQWMTPAVHVSDPLAELVALATEIGHIELQHGSNRISVAAIRRSQRTSDFCT
jgi:hypothetical protein